MNAAPAAQQWVNDRLGGYVQMSIAERREAVADLSQKGHSIREIAEITGASKSAVGRDVPNGTLDAVAVLAADDAVQKQIAAEAKKAEAPRRISVLKPGSRFPLRFAVRRWRQRHENCTALSRGGEGCGHFDHTPACS